MPLVFDSASELRRTQLQDTSLIVETGSDNFFQNETFNICEGNVADGHLENYSMLIWSNKGLFQKSPIGGGFESKQVLSNTALQELYVRILEFRCSEKGLALIYIVKDFLKGGDILIAAVAAIVAAISIDRCRAVAPGKNRQFVLRLGNLQAKLLHAAIRASQRNRRALADIADHGSSYCV